MVIEVGFVVDELSASLTPQRLELGVFPNGHRSRYLVASHIKPLEKKCYTKKDTRNRPFSLVNFVFPMQVMGRYLGGLNLCRVD